LAPGGWPGLLRDSGRPWGFYSYSYSNSYSNSNSNSYSYSNSQNTDDTDYTEPTRI